MMSFWRILAVVSLAVNIGLGIAFLYVPRSQPRAASQPTSPAQGTGNLFEQLRKEMSVQTITIAQCAQHVKTAQERIIKEWEASNAEIFAQWKASNASSQAPSPQAPQLSMEEAFALQDQRRRDRAEAEYYELATREMRRRR